MIVPEALFNQKNQLTSLITLIGLLDFAITSTVFYSREPTIGHSEQEKNGL